MRNKLVFYSFIFLSIAFQSCQKEIIGGGQDYKTLGISAHDFLSLTTYTSLEIQVSYMPGYVPDTATINNLTSFLNTRLNKPGGIQIFQQQIAASGKLSLSINEIVQIEKRNRTVFTAGNVITAHILITDGSFSNDDILAKSYWNTSICIFGKPLDDNSGGTGQVTRTRLLSTLMEHEFGHLLGLVNQGSPMQVNHLDVANGAHCNNSNCLMYYNIETMGMPGGPINNMIPPVDANCMADLKANGGK